MTDLYACCNSLLEVFKLVDFACKDTALMSSLAGFKQVALKLSSPSSGIYGSLCNGEHSTRQQQLRATLLSTKLHCLAKMG